jgi:hypothetical protein
MITRYSPMRTLAYVISLASLLGGNVEIAYAKQCPVDQMCPISFCPYMDTDDVSKKIEAYTGGCANYAVSKGYTFIKLVIPNQYPTCRVLVQVDDLKNCTEVK